ncbi:MAG: ShlB/FhaC/HecB family hemolysin secretion/activation protein [Candidatus Accumulibacter sp.]|jgi:hemolysin activation/secretion protein|nr:ShlB/FhaC/HecB family hemolysin secretion/activation protein [Accumulibacter sp.]
MFFSASKSPRAASKDRNSPSVSNAFQKRLPARISLAFFLASIGVGAHAQVSPGARDAQEILRQRERERELREQQERRPDVRLPTEETGPARKLPQNETPCFTLRTIVYPDAATRADWGWSLAAADPPDDPATGRCLGVQGLRQAMSRIQDAIIARGYVTTRVLAEPQDFSTGTLKLTLLPGRIRAIRFSQNDAGRGTVWNALPMRPGDLLNLRDIEQGLENFKRIPTAEADIRIEPGERAGESDLAIAWKQSFPFRVNFSANDGGLKTTGKYLGSTTVSADHLLTLNDLFYFSYNHSLGAHRSERGTKGHTLHYSLPYGYWMLALTDSDNRYHQTVVGLNQNYVYSGFSQTWEARLSRLVHRDALGKTNISLRGYLTRYRNYIDDTEIEVQQRRMAGWEAGVNHRRFIGRAVVDANLTWKRGTGAFSAKRAPEDDFGEGTARPRLLTADFSLNYPFQGFGQNFRYSFYGRAQWNRTPLVPQDRFAIGGRYSVRGFDGQVILMAERGWFARNDLGVALPGGQELYLGIDHGRVGGHSAQLLLGRSLTGAVLGVRGGYKAASWDVFIGTPIDKPKGFLTDSVTTGFSFSLSL